MQLLDSDWPANILAGSHFRAQETRALSPDGVCALARARLGTRLLWCLIITNHGTLLVNIAGILHLYAKLTFHGECGLQHGATNNCPLHICYCKVDTTISL